MLGFKGKLGAKEKKRKIAQREEPVEKLLFLRTISGIEIEV